MKNNNNDKIDQELCFLDEIIIAGMTSNGEKFRPSDWVDRLCGMLMQFNNQKMLYSAFLRPMVYKDMNCIAVKKKLQNENPEVFDFIFQFAKDNDLAIYSCGDFKKVNCIFCQIIEQKIPAKIIYEDDLMLAFHDAYPKAKVHFLVVPRNHVASLIEMQQHENRVNLLGHMVNQATEIALKNFGLQHGFKLNINTGKNGGQEVFHLHIHITSN